MSDRIAVMVEGESEIAFMVFVRDFLRSRIEGRMPVIKSIAFDGRIPKGKLLSKNVRNLLSEYDDVVALTDVYTGSTPRDFVDATDAKKKMREWVGKEKRFHPHAAQYEFEAWLFPFWDDLRRLSGGLKAAPRGNPELVNHDRPPSWWIADLFKSGGKRFRKVVDSGRVLKNRDLAVAAEACPELKSFLNTLLMLSGGQLLE